MSNVPPAPDAALGEGPTPCLAYALHAALWPILASGSGDVLSIRSHADQFRTDWLGRHQHLDKSVFQPAVDLWEGWSVGYSKMVSDLEQACRETFAEVALAELNSCAGQPIIEGVGQAPVVVDSNGKRIDRPKNSTYEIVYRDAKKKGYAPDFRGLVNMLLGSALLEAQGFEVPGLMASNRRQAQGRGRPREEARDRLIGLVRDRVQTDLGLRLAEHRPLLVELIMWLMPSTEERAARTLHGLLEAAARKSQGDDPWLSDGERAALEEPDAPIDAPSTAVVCGGCGRVERFDGLAKRANALAREAGWSIDTSKNSAERYRCPRCAAPKAPLELLPLNRHSWGG